jgi:transposase
MNAGRPVESPVRGDSHAGFGGRSAETERPKDRYRAAGRPYLAGVAVDQVRRQHSHTMGGHLKAGELWIKHGRWALLKASEKLSPHQRLALAQIQATNRPLYRAYLLKEQLRALYQLTNPADAPAHLDAWLAWASRSKLKPFLRLARTLRRYRDGILAAIRLGLTNARLEGLHNKIRLLSHRSYGFHSPQALIALIYLCCGGITITPPHK